MFQRIAIIAAAAVATASCSAGQDIAATEQAIDQFHRAYNDGRYGELHSGATGDITGSTNAAAWNDMLAGVKNNMGNVRSASRNGFNVSYNNGVGQVALTYDTEFERGRGREQFVYRMNNGRAQLAGYHFERTSGGSPAQPAPPAAPAAPAGPAEQPAPPPAEGSTGSEADQSAQ